MADLTNIYVLAAVILICGYIYRFFYKNFKYWEKRKIPFIKPTFPFGNATNLFIGKWTFGQFFAEHYLEFKKRGWKHGGVYYCSKPVYVPVDPEIIKKIMISDAENFPNHGLYMDAKNDPLSAHIFNMEDGPWRTVRSKLPQAFTSAKMRQMFGMIVDISDRFHQILDGLAENSKPIDIKTELSQFTADVMAACMFGMESNILEGKNKDLLQHARSFFDYQWSLYKNTMVVMIPRNVLQMFNFKIFRKQTENYVLDMFANVHKYRKVNNVIKQDLTQNLMKLMEPDENEKDFNGKAAMEPLDMKEFAAQMFVFFCAGFETSSSTMTFALYELSKNPECQTRLRNEITKVLAKHNNELTYDAIMEMKYLEAVIDETLRIYPVFPILPRVCKNDYPIPGTDAVLEKNSFVLVTNMGIQRDPEYYPEPEKFIPDRFMPENKHTRPFVSNLPFGEGPRICVGKRFGLMETKVGLVTMIKNYEVGLNAKTTEGFKFSSWELILRKTGDVWINLKKIPQK